MSLFCAYWRYLMHKLGLGKTISFDDVLRDEMRDPEFMAEAAKYPTLAAHLEALAAEEDV